VAAYFGYRTSTHYPVRILTSKKTPSHHYISFYILLLAIHSWMLPPTHHVEVAEYRVGKGVMTVYRHVEDRFVASAYSVLIMVKI